VASLSFPAAAARKSERVKRIVSVLLIDLMLTLVLAGLGRAEETTFRRVKLLDMKNKQTRATLIFSDNAKALIVRRSNRDFATIPYDRIDNISYEFTKKHRIKLGVISMLATPVVGVAVMFTKSTSHWLDIDYHDESMPKSVVLRMDKRESQAILDAVKKHTGKKAEFLGCRLCNMKN
jgi:hypothetical protein